MLVLRWCAHDQKFMLILVKLISFGLPEWFISIQHLYVWGIDVLMSEEFLTFLEIEIDVMFCVPKSFWKRDHHLDWWDGFVLYDCERVSKEIHETVGRSVIIKFSTMFDSSLGWLWVSWRHPLNLSFDLCHRKICLWHLIFCNMGASSICLPFDF